MCCSSAPVGIASAGTHGSPAMLRLQPIGQTVALRACLSAAPRPDTETEAILRVRRILRTPAAPATPDEGSAVSAAAVAACGCCCARLQLRLEMPAAMQGPTVEERCHNYLKADELTLNICSPCAPRSHPMAKYTRRHVILRGAVVFSWVAVTGSGLAVHAFQQACTTSTKNWARPAGATTAPGALPPPTRATPTSSAVGGAESKSRGSDDAALSPRR